MRVIALPEYGNRVIKTVYSKKSAANIPLATLSK